MYEVLNDLKQYRLFRPNLVALFLRFSSIFSDIHTWHPDKFPWEKPFLKGFTNTWIDDILQRGLKGTENWDLGTFSLGKCNLGHWDWESQTN